MSLGTIFVILVFSLTLKEVESYKPKPYEIENGNILMIRTRGYGFCPKHCETDHFHIGHKKEYECKDMKCNHIIYEDRVN